MKTGKARIAAVRARQILDSRGLPTVEAEVFLSDGSCGRASVPSGASTGRFEARELRDGGRPFGGKAVSRATANVEGPIARALVGRRPSGPIEVDRLLACLDGTANKSRLGANATLAVSLGCARALAASRRMPLVRYLREVYGLAGRPWLLPVPMLNFLNGGLHADSGLLFQEFMVLPIGASSFSEALRMAAEIFQQLKSLLKRKGFSVAVGDEGGFAPALRGGKAEEQALDLLLSAIRQAGYRPGRQVFLGLDVAASAFSDGRGYRYRGRRSSEEMISLYERLLRRYPILSLEDGLGEEDWEGWRVLTQKLGQRAQLVGDDLFVTNPGRLSRGLRQGCANAILLKTNQIGTLTETVETCLLAERAGYNRILSHRSGETEDPFLADLCVALACGQIKTGGLSRSERLAKYNQLLRLEEDLGRKAEYAGRTPFRRFL